MNTALYTRFAQRLYHACLKYNPNFISVVFSVSVNLFSLGLVLSAHVVRSIRIVHSLTNSSRPIPSASSARRPLTSFTHAYESAQSPTHVCCVIRPVIRPHLCHRLRLPLTSFTIACVAYPRIRSRCPLSSSSTSSIYFICSHLRCLLSSSVPMHFHDHSPFSGHISPRTARHNRRAKNTTYW